MKNSAVDRDGLTIVNDLRIGNYLQQDPRHGIGRATAQIPDSAARAPVFLTGGVDVSRIKVTYETQHLPHSPMLMHLRRRVDGPEDLQFEALIVMWSNPESSYGYQTRMLTRMSNSSGTFLWPVSVDVDADGKVLDRGFIEPPPWHGDNVFEGPQLHVALFWNAAAILTLINTPRLITYEPAPIGPHLLQRWERKPQQKIDYRVIRLPDGRLSHGRSIPVDGVPAGVALHSVRGHFVTYTDNAPLFGKLTGTFWHKPAVRGSDRHGQVVKDYDVRQPDNDTQQGRTA